MVDIKREDITLQDWTKGISADEFAWGSYFYAEWIQTWYSTKGFRLWPYLDVRSLNERVQGYPVAVCNCKWSLVDTSPNVIYFTKDHRLEMQWSLNGSTSWEWWEHWWGAIFSPYWWGISDWYGGFVYGDYALAFQEDVINKIAFKDTYNMAWQTIPNPRFENSAAWWTVWTWWTLTDNWMEHTTWNTWTLEVSADWYADGTWRLAIKITWCTAGNVVLSVSGTNVVTTEAWKNWWFVDSALNIDDNTTYTITITPSSDFDGNVEAVNFNVYKTASINTEIHWLTAATKHLAIEWAWDIFISSWNTIDILSTVDRTISASKKLARDDEEIVALTQQADSIIIWATNGIDSHQYYWNWVDNVASEVILWQWQIIQWVTWTETISYVLAWAWGVWSWNAYRLYSVSWYQRSLIASNAYKVQSTQWNLEHYHPSKKFAFNDVDGSQGLCVYLDNLYIPWCDGIYQFWQTIPWLSNSWSRPINYQNWASRLFLYQDGSAFWFTYSYQRKQYYVIVNNDTFNYYWYLVTDSLYWDKLWTRKALEKIKLSYKSVPAEDGQINVYAIVDDDYFWRFDVSWITNRPAIWDVYEVAEDTTAEVIDIKKTSSSKGTITFRTVNNGGSLLKAYNTLDKVSWDGDNTITTNWNYDNMIWLKTIAPTKQEYGADFIFWKDFVNNYIPFWHKIQFVIELVKNNTTSNRYRTPEIYELSFVSDVTDTIL